ncbi:MAG: polymer-forming cytoskeletal protein [Patescibacteria group bacterium]
MFNKDNKTEKFKDAETIIGASIKVKGNFVGQGNIVIEGHLEGSIKTEADLFVGEKARIVANIEASQATINGEIKGNLKIHDYLAVGSAAKIFGDVIYSEISIEKGAVINGQLLKVSGSDKNRSKTANTSSQEEVEDVETDEE